MSSPEPRPSSPAPTGQLVVGAALLLIVLQLVFRGGAALHGWFYWDDFEFLSTFAGRGLHLHDLLAPHDSQFMPGGLLLSWVVAHSGAFNWTSAALILIALQLVADLACLWMLLTLFGRRWACLGLLALYLFSTMTLTAFMWWAAAINQIPVQAACFAAITFHVRYLRTRRLREAAVAALVIVVGLLFYVKAALIVIPIAVLTLVWFREPAPHRLWRTLRAHAPVAVGYAVVGIGYAVYYVIHVPNPLNTKTQVPYGGLADTMLHQALVPELLGGPWRWADPNPPVAVIDTPGWAVDLSWVLVAVAVAILLQRHRADWRAVLVVLPYLAATFVLTAVGRAAVIGADIGRELRYLADATPILVLNIGLFLLPLAPSEREQHSPTAEQATPRWRTRALAGCAVFALATGAAVSNVSYVRHWTGGFAAESFVSNVATASSKRPLNILDATVPKTVMGGITYPYNLPSRLFRPLGDRVVAVTTGTDPQVLDSHGHPSAPLITGGATSLPGPLNGCGYAIKSQPTTVPMQGKVDFFWWLRVSYFAGASGELDVSLGGVTHRLATQAGVHDVFLNGSGSIQDLSMATDDDQTICVDRVAIGPVGAAS